MRQWLRYFRIWFIICGILCAVCIGSLIKQHIDEKNAVEAPSTRVNTYCTEKERVFDYGDVLTDEEENQLRELIAEKEKIAKCDIIILTMNESLEDYAKSYDPNVPSNQYVMIKADNFYDEYGFGWNKTKEEDDGDGCILLDNWYRESDGKIHTWLSTSGTVEMAFSSATIDKILDHVYEYVEYDPYRAYKVYVEDVAKVMGGDSAGSNVNMDRGTVTKGSLILATVVAGIFILTHLSSKEGKRTTTPGTYISEPGVNYDISEDRFINKTVRTRHIERSSSGGGGGGGGHHVSSGGHSHGGGGHSR